MTKISLFEVLVAFQYIHHNYGTDDCFNEILSESDLITG